MTGEFRTIRVPSFAKINLRLKVLYKRPDHYHELRTIFQTISIRDDLEITVRRARRTTLSLESSVDIPDNLVLRAARAVLDAVRATAEIAFRLTKRIPMGGGLGGGSSNAAAVLLGLPPLLGKPLPNAVEVAAGLGSDVPFFLLGGTALGLGRGEELYPFPEPKPSWGLLVTPGIHIATAEAYSALGRELTVTSHSPKIGESRSMGWDIGEGLPVHSWRNFVENDFEEVVFQKHPQILNLKKKLLRAGGSPVLMTGSGSAVFGFFESRAAAENARKRIPVAAEVFQTVSRARFRSAWLKGTANYVRANQWPPQNS